MVEPLIQTSRRAGWSQQEANMLWETADEAQVNGLPLKSVFEHIATQTGRRPNSIRNYYYAQVQRRMGDEPRTKRFVPFGHEEVRSLMEQVLRERAKGHSVRSCLQRMANGDHSLMLRYQNKYRSVLKSRPELVNELVEQLRGEGIDVYAPEVNHRPRTTLQEACSQLTEGARGTNDPELIRACETLSRFMQGTYHAGNRAALGVRLDLYRMALEEKQEKLDVLAQSTQSLIASLKEFLACPRGECTDMLCDEVTKQMGPLEQLLQSLENE